MLTYAGVCWRVQATALVHRGAPLFGEVQATFNLLEQSSLGALKAAHDAGMFVVIKESLANGIALLSFSPSVSVPVLS